MNHFQQHPHAATAKCALENIAARIVLEEMFGVTLVALTHTTRLHFIAFKCGMEIILNHRISWTLALPSICLVIPIAVRHSDGLTKHRRSTHTAVPLQNLNLRIGATAALMSERRSILHVNPI